jgi:flagellar basal-body rod protein FlgC
MVSPISTSLAGLQVAAKRVQVASTNLANQQSTATRVNGDVVDEAYKPQRVVTTTVDGVPTAQVQTVANPTQKLYLPDSPQADEYGFVEMPNVDQAAELVEMKIASYDYKANLKAIQVQDKIQQALLDILS